MLKLKISKNPPEHACLLAFVSGSEFSPANVGIHDLSLEWAENRTGFDHGGFRAVSFQSSAVYDSITHPGIVPFNTSCRREDLVDPTPLPWAHRIGANTALGRRRYYLYSGLADGINPTTDALMWQVLSELKRAIKVLEIDGTPTKLPWDLNFLDITAAADRRVPMTTGYGWDVYLMLPVRDRPLWVQFAAIDTGGNITHNFRELVNATPYYTGGDVVNEGDPIPGGDDYALELRNDGSIRFLDANTIDEAMAFTLWTPDSGWDWRWTAAAGGTFEIRLSAVVQYSIASAALNGMTVKELVQDINNPASANWVVPGTGVVRATLLLDYPAANELIPAAPPTGPFAVTPWGGFPIRYRREVGAWYPAPARMLPLPMEPATREEQWMPILDFPPVRKTIASGALTGAVVSWVAPDREWMPFSSVWTTSLEAREVPTLVLPNLLQLDHGRVQADSIRVLIDGQDMTGDVIDYDAQTGLILLSRDVTTADSIEVLYAWDPEFKIQLDWLNLNPGQLHFPEGYKVLIGVYVTASRIAPLVGPGLDLEPTIGWVMGENVADLQAAVAALADSGTGYNLQAQLIAVYQVASTVGADGVRVLDVRSLPGVRKPTLEDLQSCPEIQFYTDYGFVDGLPYPGQGVVIVHGPGSILGTDTSIPGMAPPADGGFVDTTGRQQLEDIRRRAQGHVTAGMYPIVDLE